MAKHDHASPKRARLDARLVLALVLFGAAFGIAGYLLLSDPQAHAANASETRVLGRPIARELDAHGDFRAIAQKLARVYLRQPLTLYIDKRAHVRTRAALGIEVDLPAFTELLRAATNARSPLRRLHAQQRGDVPLDLPVPAHIEGDRAERWLRSLAASIDEPARPAHIRFDSGAVSAARAGRELDVMGTLDQLDEAVFRGAVSTRAVLRVLAPSPSPFTERDRLDVSQVMGSFESREVTGVLRTSNLEAVARKLDGTLLDAHETFDFRASLGPVYGGRGLHAAGVSSSEGDQLDAALSQVASTLYAAALFAGLPIVEQHARPRPSHDIELGFDAAVTGKRNLRFQNDLRSPIAIAIAVQGGKVRASLRGAAGFSREVDVELSVDVVAPYVERTRADPGLPLGAMRLVQRGRPALRVQLTRSVRETIDDTSQREQRFAVYPPSPRIVRLGSGDAAQRAPSPAIDEPAEYLVDELVGFGMRPGLVLPQESERHPGRTGVAGWSAQDGP